MSLWIEQLLQINKFSRPAIPLVEVRGIVIHWTATPGASDESEVKFFDGEDGGGSRYAGAHLFVDKDSARLDIPLDEVAYHANDHDCRIEKLKASVPKYKGGNANLTTIGIEMCVEKDGTLHSETVKRTCDIAAELCKKFNLNPLTDIYRHFDITGKNCPAPWVTNPSLFEQFKKDVQTKLVPPTPPMWNNEILKNGQIGKLEVLKPINLWRDNAEGKLEMVRVLNPGEQYRVYGYRNDHQGQYNLGGTWVTKMDGYVKYSTPSKSLIEQTKAFYGD